MSASDARASTFESCRASSCTLVLDGLALVEVEGRDAADLLQRVTSQDVVGLDVGSGARATILSGKGKMLAFFEVFRPAPDRFVLEVGRDLSAELVERIDRYVFAEDVRVRVLPLHGVGAFGPDVARTSPGFGVTATEGGYEVWSSSFVVPGRRRWLPEGSLPTESMGDMQDWHALRIDAGVPWYGLDADDKTIPLEVGLDDACDASKGCYPGQEIVARIRTYGHVNRQLCRLRVDGADVPAHGVLIYDEDDLEAGRITSAYAVPGGPVVHALGMLPRALASVGNELRVGAIDGPRAVVY
ncbi:MAG: folate-binding protein YgfZ [Planctomycetes bacterium]|nr:folate-binding protein YgfZ [Planctomycetota bacterium]